MNDELFTMNKENQKSRITFPKKGRGFTLVELLLYVTISSSVLLVTVMFMAAMLEARVKNEVIAEVEQQGLFAMHTMLSAGRSAQGVLLPTIGITGASLSLDVYTVLNDPTIFDISAGALRIKEGAAAVVPLTNGLVTATGLSVTNLSRPSTPGTIRIMFTLTHVNLSGRGEYRYSKSFTGTATLRQP